ARLVCCWFSASAVGSPNANEMGRARLEAADWNHRVGIEDVSFGTITPSVPSPQPVGTSVTFAGTITDTGPFPTPWPASSLSVPVDDGSPISFTFSLSATAPGFFSLRFTDRAGPVFCVGSDSILFTWADDGIGKAAIATVSYTLTPVPEDVSFGTITPSVPS